MFLMVAVDDYRLYSVPTSGTLPVLDFKHTFLLISTKPELPLLT